MSGGWATGVGIGLLGSINKNIEGQRAMQQKMQMEGDKEQLDAFQRAQTDYESLKNKNAEEGDKEDTMAKAIADTMGHSVGPSDFSTARFAVENGYTGPEHWAYVMDAAKHTYNDMLSNPDKWGVPDTSPRNFDQDSNPTQTALLRKMGNQTGLNSLEAIRQRYAPAAHSGLPGPTLGDPDTIAAAKAYSTKAADIKATNDAGDTANNPNGIPASWYKQPNSASTPAPQAPAVAAPQAPQGGSVPQVPSSQLQPPAQNFARGGPVQSYASGGPVSDDDPSAKIQAAVSQALPGNSQTTPPLPTPPMSAQNQDPTAQDAVQSSQPGAGIPLSGPAPQPAAQAPAQPQAAPPAPSTSPQAQGQAQAQPQGQAQQQSQPAPQQPQSTAAPTPFSTQPSPELTPRGEYVSGVRLNNDFLESLNPVIGKNVEGIASGRININTLVPPRSPNAQQLRNQYFAAVQMYDPTWDENTYHNRTVAQGALNNPNGKTYQSVMSAERLTNHLLDLDKAIDKIPNVNGGFGPLNSTVNSLIHSTANASGSTAYTDLEGAREAVADEAPRLFRGSAGALGDVQARLAQMESTKTPAQLHEAVRELVILMRGQIDPLQEQHDSIMGPHTKDVINSKTQAALEKLSGEKDDLFNSPQPNQQVNKMEHPTFTSPNDPALKKLAPGSYFRDDKGTLRQVPN